MSAFSQSLRLLAAPEECFPERCLPRPGQIRPETPTAQRGLLLLLPHSFPSFEALIVQYYNLKTSIIYFMLKRKNSFFSLSLFSKAVHSFTEAYCSVYTGGG